MKNTRTLISGLALVVGLAAGAVAADSIVLPTTPVADTPTPAQRGNTGWYFKGFLGNTNYSADAFSRDAGNLPGLQTFNLSQTFDSSGFAGIGIGYRATKWLRLDVTGEYRGKATLNGLFYTYYPLTSVLGTFEYTASLKSQVWLANVYGDIGHWHGFTPYVGGGIGFAQNTMGDFSDLGVNTVVAAPGYVASASAKSESNFAWALHAGVAYDVTPDFTVDFAYRFLNLGQAQSGLVQDSTGNSHPSFHFDDLRSNDLMLGFRCKFGR